MRLVILDRDGVINQDSDQFIKSLEEWIPIPGSIDAIARLSRNSFIIAVATNQSGIARGLLDLETLKVMHQRLQQLVADAGGQISRIVFCPHGPEDNCGCRKPKTGLFQELFNFLGMPDKCWAIGDSLRDLEAGIAAGCQPILVRTGKGNKTAGDPRVPSETVVKADLAAAADWLIREQSN